MADLPFELKAKLLKEKARQEALGASHGSAETPAREPISPEEYKRRLEQGRIGQRALGYGIADALTLGGADEIVSAFTNDIDETRANRKEARETAPESYTMGQIAGSTVASAIPIGGAISATRGQPLWKQMGAGGLTGMGLAATQGFLEGEGGFLNRMGNAWNPRNLAVGFGVGGLSPVVAKLLGHSVSTPRNPNEAFRKLGYSKPVARTVGDTYAMESEFKDVGKYLDELGPEATLADAGPAFKGAAGGLAATPGPQSPALYNALEARGAEAVNRVTKAIDDVLGPRMNMTNARESLRAAQSAEAKQAYDAFNATSVPITPELRDMLTMAERVGALKKAREVAVARGFDFNPETYLDPATKEISGEAVDLISRSLRDASKKAWKDGEGALGEALGTLNDRFLDRVPELKQIRTKYASQMDIREAAEAGGDLLNSRVSADEFMATWDKMSDAEKAAFRASARDAIEQKMATSPYEASAGIRILGPRAVTDKIEIAFGKGAGFDLDRVIRAEKAMRDNTNEILRNSMTARRQAEQKKYAGVMDEAGNPIPPLSRAGQVASALLGKGARAVTNLPPGQIGREMGQVLTATGPERDRIVQALAADLMRRNQQQQGGKAVEAISRYLVPGVALPALSE